MKYTSQFRFWLIIVPIFLALIGFSVATYFLLNGSRINGESFGQIAAWGLGGTIVLALVNYAMRRFLKIKKLLGRHGEILKPKHHRFLILQKKWIIDVHLMAGILGFLGALLHAYTFWNKVNAWLIISMVLFGEMTIVGLVLKFGGLGPKTKKYAYLLHSQWIIVILLVIATLIGHVGF